MKFRYTIEEISKNGTRNLLNRDLDKDEIILGRGSGSDIHFESSYVSLNHARIVFSDGKPIIEDLGSLSGISVNNQITKRQNLKEDDEVKLGDVTLTVFFSGGIWGLHEKRVEQEKVDTEKLIERDVTKISIARLLPSLKYISIIFLLLVVGFFFVLPMTGGSQDSWNSGPISNHHSMIATDCLSCHGGNFSRVADKQCISCHNMTDHADKSNPGVLKAHHSSEARCATCHMEHNGDNGLVLKESKLCTDCHANITSIVPDSTRPSVPSFNEHPEFSVEVQPALPGAPVTRARLDDLQNLKDNSNVKLNHEVHLRTIRTKTGTVKLGCRDCHNSSPDRQSIEPINFENHCATCHTLEFDDRLAGRQVPHGDPDVVFKFLYAEYAKLLLSSEETSSNAQDFRQRFKPGGSIVANQAPAQNDDFKRSFVEKESRNAERLLFTKTACYLCHRIVQKEITDEQATAKSLSKFEVMTPQIPQHWMPYARFDHGAHEAVTCDDCHKGVYQSTKTNQVLLPGVKDCTNCHNDHAGNGLVKSDCVMCHSFHDQKLVEPAAKRKAEEILNQKVGTGS